MFKGLGSHKIRPKIAIFGQKLGIACDFQRAVIPKILTSIGLKLAYHIHFSVIYPK